MTTIPPPSEDPAGVIRATLRNRSGIAGDYLKDEARHDFQSEGTLFAIITIAAALPLINNVHALIEFVRAITS